MGIGDLLSRQAVGVRATAPNKRQLLHGLADLAAPALGVPAEAVFEGLLEREALRIPSSVERRRMMRAG